MKRQSVKFIEKEIAIAIYNDDFSGLSDDEITLINEYIKNMGKELIIPDDCENKFTRCEVLGKYADCIGCIFR